MDAASGRHDTTNGKGRKPLSRLEIVLEHIKQRIADGTLKPGAQLPPEIELARELGLSRTPVREAVKVLGAAGILVVKHGHGTFVSASAQASLGQLLLFEIYMKDTTPQKLMEVRLLFERACAELAAQRRTEEDLAAMRECIDRLRPLIAADPVDYDATVEADLAFHRAIYRAAQNELVETLANFVLTMVSGWLRRSHAHGGLADTVRLHEIMYRMIETRDAGGAREAYGAEVNMEHFRKVLEQIDSREGKAGGRP
ncbi:FadR/GntR family transcriptional regulator [Bosea sp. (in: a-proteobacteria)]|uniref:FadR/GntR family transcriptional regulator n=1 Tax=Bosea sp. (in: a-proteobacteria) TaxID=1871050 RepID=UPI002732DA2B|nr:FadR/GntR family transcriptional regulator [Bosea sp. (in: a-proteobacteria)]MDP3256759.1 FadR/GntR family transcriptional regulator [Bosea sp. (in: a-proteobacteria)]